MEISKEDFDAYEAVRQSGVTNMFDARMVGSLTGLTLGQIMKIMKNYDTYKGGNYDG